MEMAFPRSTLPTQTRGRLHILPSVVTSLEVSKCFHCEYVNAVLAVSYLLSERSLRTDEC